MRRLRFVVLSSLFLAVIGLVSYRWAELLQRSVHAYASPLASVSITPGEQLPGLTKRVVMVVVSGLSYRETVVQDMPTWQSLASVGASAPVQMRPPSYWPSVWAALLTGAESETNRAPLLPSDVGNTSVLKTDNILAAAKEADLRIAVAASGNRASTFVSAVLDATYFTQSGQGEADAQVVEAALGFIAEQSYHLIIVHLGLPDSVGQQHGTTGQAYRAALRQVDSYVRQIVRQMILAESVLVLTSDSSLLSDGRPAGGLSDPPTLPLVMVGQGIVAGEYSPVRLSDIAPTLSALLGIRLPVMSGGRPLLDMMELQGDALTRCWLLLARQKVSLAEAYIRILQYSPARELLQQDLHTATQSFRRSNNPGAIAAAQLVADEATSFIASAKNARIRAERWPRLLVFALGAVVPLLFFSIRRPTRLALILFAAIATMAVLYALYGLGGQDFSFNILSGVSDYFSMPLVRDALIGLMVGGLAILLGFLSNPPSRWQTVVTTTCDYALLVCYLASLPALVAYWQHGAWVTWYLPDPFMLAWQALSLRHMTFLAVASLPLPWLLGAIIWLNERRKVQISGRARAWDPIANLRR